MTTAVVNPYVTPQLNQQMLATQTGSAGIETNRVIAELQAAVMLARRFPRGPARCMDSIIQECQRQSLAEVALYTYSRGGTEITGPSIRLAETIARHWTNLDFGIKEIYQEDGRSEMMAYAWDLETNVRQTKVFVVEHIRYTKRGVKKLTDPRDIYETVANAGARRLRACILGVIPRDVIDTAIEQCERTIEQFADPETVAKMVAAFERIGVSKAQIEKRIQRSIRAISAVQVASLRKIHTSIKEGISEVADWFEVISDDQRELNSQLGAVSFDVLAKPLKLERLEDYLSELANSAGITVDQVKAGSVVAGTLKDFAKSHAEWLALQKENDGNNRRDDGHDSALGSGIDAGASAQKEQVRKGSDGGSEKPPAKPPTVQEAHKWCSENALLGKYFEDKRIMVEVAATSLNIDMKGKLPRQIHQEIINALAKSSEKQAVVEYADKDEQAAFLDGLNYFNEMVAESKMIQGGAIVFRQATDAAGLKTGQRPETLEQCQKFKETYLTLMANHKVGADMSKQAEIVEEPGKVWDDLWELVNRDHKGADFQLLKRYINQVAAAQQRDPEDVARQVCSDKPFESDFMDEFSDWKDGNF